MVTFSVISTFCRLARSLLTDSRHFWKLACLVVAGDAVFTELIIRYVPYTEIDWETYIAQVDVFLKGETNYSRISGPTGPIVYPAGHIWIHTLLRSITQEGNDIDLAQHIYGALYILSLALACGIYYQARTIPNWVLLLLPLSKRLHSIFVLRLFNDCWSVVAVQAAILAYQQGLDDIGSLCFSAALSVKMSILLYLPGLLVVFVRRRGIVHTLRHLVMMISIQLLVAIPFLQTDAYAYLTSSFNLARVFLYEWTVNWRMIGEQMFLSPQWANGLFIGHITMLVLFGLSRWCRSDGGAWVVLRRGLLRPTRPAGLVPVSSDEVTTILFTSNLIGIIFARSLHYQFYSWYAQQVPFLAWKTQYSVLCKLALIVGIEYTWNVFPSTTFSSTILLLSNSILLAGIWQGGTMLETNRY